MHVSRIPSAYLPLNGVKSDGEQTRRTAGFFVESSTTEEDVCKKKKTIVATLGLKFRCFFRSLSTYLMPLLANIGNLKLVK